MENKVCFVSVDVEPDSGKNGFQGVENLPKILELFEKFNVPATLFVAGEVLEQYPEKFKEWGRDFEISSHSFTHRFWSELSFQQRQQELDKFIKVYGELFSVSCKGFRAPSHLIDTEGLKLLEKKGFLYDSSILPHYPFFKKYRGYQGRAPLLPYYPAIENCRKQGKMRILEIPIRGQMFGIPLVGSWLSKLPFFVYEVLFAISTPPFLTLNLHSWDVLSPKFLNKLDKILKLLKKKNYQFLPGVQIYELLSKNRRQTRMAEVIR